MLRKLPLLLVFSLAASNTFADSQRATYQNDPAVEETTGALSGAIIGGLAGGPPGFIFGSAVGALFGEGWRAKKDVGDLQASVFSQQLELTALREEAEVAQRNFELAQMQLNDLRSSARVIPANLESTSSPCCDNTVISLHFRSGSSSIESQYEEQLRGLVNIAKQMPNPRIEITGYADRNGDADRNLLLSRDRSGSVKQFFNREGVQNSSIQTVAYGETDPLNEIQSLETDFFDRRVIVRLRDGSIQMLTQSQDSQ
jgi:sortase system peptidoglycan-associated protein